MVKERVKEDISFMKAELNELLAKQTAEAYAAVLQVAEMDYVKGLAQHDNDIKNVQLFASIYKAERDEGIDYHFLTQGRSIAEISETYYKILFFLQRVWFEVEEEFQMEMVPFAIEKGISPYAIFMILKDSRIVDKDMVWKNVMRLWEKADE